MPRCRGAAPPPRGRPAGHGAPAPSPRPPAEPPRPGPALLCRGWRRLVRGPSNRAACAGLAVTAETGRVCVWGSPPRCCFRTRPGKKVSYFPLYFPPFIFPSLFPPLCLFSFIYFSFSPKGLSQLHFYFSSFFFFFSCPKYLSRQISSGFPFPYHLKTSL